MAQYGSPYTARIWLALGLRNWWTWPTRLEYLFMRSLKLTQRHAIDKILLQTELYHENSNSRLKTNGAVIIFLEFWFTRVWRSNVPFSVRRALLLHLNKPLHFANSKMLDDLAAYNIFIPRLNCYCFCLDFTLSMCIMTIRKLDSLPI